MVKARYSNRCTLHLIYATTLPSRLYVSEFEHFSDSETIEKALEYVDIIEEIGQPTMT
jgi:hypothetical protein